MEHWQIRLFRHSLMKRDKVHLVSRLVDFSNQSVFDLGCSNGAVSYFLKQKGGDWTHADLDLENLKTAAPVLGKNLFQMGESGLPLRSGRTDLVMTLDILEHLRDDRSMVKEIYRILKPGGKIVVSTPISGGFFLINRLKEKAGMGPEIYGHVREGYSLKALHEILESEGFRIGESTTYAKFFTPLCEFMLNLTFTRVNRIRSSTLHSGAISPSSSGELDKSKGLYRIYTRLVYPLIRLFTRLDLLLFWKTEYATLVIAEKPS